MTEKYLTLKEVAEHLKIGKSTLYRYIETGVLPRPFKLGNAVRYKESVIESALHQLAVGSGGEDQK